MFELVERVLQHQRAAVRIADEHERLVWADALPHVAHADADGSEPIFPNDSREAGRHRAVPRHPQRQTVVAACFQRFPKCAHAVGRIGETVDQESAAADFAGWHNLYVRFPSGSRRDGDDRLRRS